MGIAILGGMPAALTAAGWLHPDEPIAGLMMMAHGGSGMFAGFGYVAVFGLIAARVTQPGAVAGSLAALGRRSLSGYLFHSVAWLVLLLPFGLAVGTRFATPTIAGLVVATGVWLTTVVLARRLDKRGKPGPAEVVLRRLAYGRRV